MTDNFLHNLRNQGNKRFDRNRNKPFDNQFRQNDRFSGRDRKAAPQRKPGEADQLQAIKRLLEGLLEQQRRLVECSERSALAAERQADALERILNQPRPADNSMADAPPHVDAAPPAAVEDAAVQDAVFELDAEPEADDSDDAFGGGDPRETAAQVILTRRSQGQGFEQIAQHLNDLNVPTISGRGSWRAQTVSRLFNTLSSSQAPAMD